MLNSKPSIYEAFIDTVKELLPQSAIDL